MDTARKTLFNIRVTDEEKEQLQRLADKESRTMSNYIRHLIKKEIEAEKNGR